MNTKILLKIESQLLRKFINNVSIRNQNTAIQYHSRLLFFAKFAKEKYGINLNEMIQKPKDNEFDPYDILNDYCLYLKNNYNLSSRHLEIKL